MKKAELEKLAKKIIQLIDEESKIKVEESGGLRILIDSPSSGLLIGRHGETLEALQHIFRLIVAKTTTEFVPVTVDVAGYKEAKTNEIKELALQVAENVKKSGYAQTLRPMNSYERRTIHVALADFKGIETTSVGEEPYRSIEIKPKK